MPKIEMSNLTCLIDLTNLTYLDKTNQLINKYEIINQIQKIKFDKIFYNYSYFSFSYFLFTYRCVNKKK